MTIEHALCYGYQPPGPVAARFIHDVEHQLCGIMGPVGSGKTTACPIKALHLSKLQRRSKFDGVRRCQGVVLRSTYRDLWDKAIPSWQAVFPVSREWPWQGGRGEPATHVITLIDPHAGPIEMTVLFRAIGDENADAFARGLSVAWIWGNELDTLPEIAIAPLMTRLGRSPEAHTVNLADPPGPIQFFGDMNAPNAGNWTYQSLIRAPNDLTALYVQPGGLDPDAENPMLRANRPTYYTDLMRTMDEYEVERFVHNKPGFSRAGMPVWKDYSEALHVLRGEPPVLKDRPILIGADAKSQAAAVFGQLHDNGRLVILAELRTAQGDSVDGETFGQRVRGVMSRLFPGLPGLCAPDPTAWNQDYTLADRRSWAQVFATNAGVGLWRPPTNDEEKRIAAVRRLLKQLIHGRPALLFAESCVDIREAVNVGYRRSRRRSKDSGGNEFTEHPIKNEWSHIADALQYLCLMVDVGIDAMHEASLAHAETVKSLRPVAPGAPSAILEW